MAANIPGPNLNQGISAGIMGPRFGNDRGESFGSPMYMAGNQPTTTIQSNFRHTYNMMMRPADNNWDSRINNGTLLFIQRKAAIANNIMTLESVRYYVHQAAITQWNDTKTARDLGKDGAEVLKSRPRGRGLNFGFLGDIESIRENLAFMGPAIGPTIPGTSAGATERIDSSIYTGDFKMVPFVTWGHGYIPNFWGDIANGRDVWMVCKPMPAQEAYFSPSGTRNVVPEDMRKKKCLIPDFHFTTHRPMDICSTKELFAGAGEQPPLDSAEWIDWKYDENNAIESGEIKRGIVWQVGYCPHGEKGQHAGVHVPGRKAERMPWKQDYNDLPQMEILMESRVVTGYK